jgi:hypothetical protein
MPPLTDPSLTRHIGGRAHLNPVLDLSTLLGLADGIGGVGGVGQVELKGSGPVGFDVVRDLLADPKVAVTMRRLITDPVTGHLLDYGRRTYDVPQALRDFIISRDQSQPKATLPLPRLPTQGQPVSGRQRGWGRATRSPGTTAGARTPRTSGRCAYATTS